MDVLLWRLETKLCECLLLVMCLCFCSYENFPFQTNLNRCIALYERICACLSGSLLLQCEQSHGSSLSNEMDVEKINRTRSVCTEIFKVFGQGVNCR
jgi:hypothetical protein